MTRRPIRILLAAVAAVLFAATVARAQETLRFIMVTHGSASNPFWATIKEAAERAAEEAGVEVIYRAPESFDLEAMAALVTAAVEEKPAGLIVSIPNADALAGPMRAAQSAGIPVVSINSGFDIARSLGAILHVGQGEYEAGRVAGEAMRERGGTRALCLNHEVGNVALDLRCKGFIDGFGGSVEVLPVANNREEVGKAVEAKLADDAEINVVLALNASIAGEPAIEAAKTLRPGRTVRVGTFDLTENVLAAVADDLASFAIDQQPFLQGYLPVQFLVLLKRDDVVPVSNVSTGPRLITAEEARRRLGRPATLQTEGEPAEPSGG